MNRTLRAESGTKVTKEDVWDQVSVFVGRFGQAAEQFAARFDFGISPEAIRGCMEPILSDARRTQLAGWTALRGGPALQECLARLRDLAPTTYQKTVARIAGVFVIHSYFRSRMTQEAIGQAISTGSFYEVMQDLLDDLLDGGGFTVPEAVRLYNRCLRPMIDPEVSANGLEDELANFMGPGQDGLEHVLAGATRALRGLLASSDERIRGLIHEGHEALARAQATTVLFRREGLDIPAATNLAAGLPSPDPDLTWLDRVAIYASWPSTIALFDAGFTTAAVPQRELAAHARAWLSFNEAVTFLEHFAGIEGDVREGVVNMACIYENLPATGLEGNSFGGFTSRQRQSIFEKATACLVRGVREGITGGGPPEEYALLAVMIPTIIFAMCKTPPDQAASFFAILAPSLRATIGTEPVMSEVAIPA